jgi:transposase
MRTDRDPDRLSWEWLDALWPRMDPLIPAKNGKTAPPRTIDLKRMAEGLFTGLRTGMQWPAYPRDRFGPPSTVYDSCVQWVKAGLGARRWGGEVGHAGLHRLRNILVRFEKTLATHRAWLQLACADIVLKRAEVLREARRTRSAAASGRWCGSGPKDTPQRR